MGAPDLRHQLRRIWQTPRTFANWPDLLTGLARERLGRGPGTLTFRTRDGQTIEIPNAPGARVPAYEVFAEDCYDLRWFLGDLLNEPIHVLDVGAHVGTFALWLGSVHPQATVDCFEPSSDTVEYLRRNVAANGLSDRIAVHQQALAGEHGWASFEQHGAGSGHNHLVMEGAAAGGLPGGTAAQVETVTFDEVVAGARGPVRLVKMDCEGGEFDLVYKSSPESWATVDRLVLEYHRVEGNTWQELRSWFADAGLHVLRDERGRNAGTAWLSRTPLRDPEGRGPRTRASTLAYEARRVAQTPRTFTNWPGLLSGLVREKLGRGPDTLTFETRSGQRLTAPNVPGARLPAYEQYAEDGYRLEWFLGPLRDRPIHAFDVGAHVGTFACHLAEVHPGATITCFEPSAETARYLQGNLERNGLAARATVVEAALAGESGWALFAEHGNASVHSGLVEDHPVDDPHAGATTVKVRTIGFDDAVASAPGPVAFVKLDCEGGEYQLAYRSSPESWASVERVVLEYHDTPGESWSDLRAWFAGVGLHVVAQRSERADLGTAWLARGELW